jgi:hypothetical protein
VPDLGDYELHQENLHAPVRPDRPAAWGRWIAAALIVVAAAAAAYVFWWRAPARPSETAPAAPAAETRAPRRPLGGAAEPVDVPPLALTDPLVRQLVGRLSSHPSMAAWLATDGLIRNFVVVVENVAHGTTPAPHLRVVRPSERFEAADRDGALFVDPRSYERYDTLAEAAASIDPAGAATVYGTLKPRIEEAYRELGRTDSFDEALERAIVVVLETPTVDGDVPLVPGPVGYRYADPSLERLSAAQKQVVRMGPRNTAMVQAALREIGIALGIPAERLRR